MPNHVRNVWKIKNIPPDQVNYLVNKLTTFISSDDSGIAINERIIDFDLIIPAPRLKADCPKDSIRSHDSCSQIDETRPWFDWYEFNTKHWGTKWNAYDGYTKIGKTYIQLVFNTAWNFAYPIALALTAICKQNSVDCDLRYADEDYGANCGMLKYNHKTDDITHYDESDISENPAQWARNLWDRY